MKRLTTHETRYNHLPNESQLKSRNYKCGTSQGKRQVHSEECSRREDSSDRYTDDDDDSDDCDGQTEQRKAGVSDWDGRRNGNPHGAKINHKCNDSAGGGGGSVLYQPYYCEEKTKKNKKTQKNLISPTPSLLTPISRKGPISQIRCKVPSKSAKDAGNVKPPKKSVKGEDHLNEESVLCFHHHQHHREGDHDHDHDRSHRTEKIDYNKNCCVMSNSPDGPSSVEGDDYWKDSPQQSRDLRHPLQKVSGGREVSCHGCLKSPKMENCVNNHMSMTNRYESEKELIVHNSFGRNASTEEGSRNSMVKTREKLVYVVEEDGNQTTKLETDLFSVNEILAIKKDLLELSEFAKKLKKLKDMKRESDNTKKDGKPCTCKPVSELLCDVNRRIEALEARQQELESRKTSKKESFQTGSKDATLKSLIISSQTKAPGPTHASVVATNPDDSKPEAIVSTAEGFCNNSEIVCELLDIKTQIQKLEKRKMSKDNSVEAMPGLSPGNAGKKKGHSIAVFSSRTYILASPNNFRKGRKKKNVSKSADNKGENASDAMDAGNAAKPEEKNWKSKTEKTKENVSNWLKNVPSGTFAASEMRKSKTKDESLHKHSFRCRKCNREMKDDDFEIQERQKNRASEYQAGTSDNETEMEQRTQCSGPDFSTRFECKECILTNSGRLFAFDRKSTPRSPVNSSERKTSPRNIMTSTLMDLLHRSSSSYSVPSSFAFRNQNCTKRLRKGNESKPNHPEGLNLNSSMSKSMQELGSGLNVDKTAKTILNTTKRNSASSPSDPKQRKDSKNEMVKRILVAEVPEGKGNLDKEGAAPVAASSHSYLVREVNLEEDKTAKRNSFQNKDNSNKTQVFSTTAVLRSGFEIDECDSVAAVKASDTNDRDEQKRQKKLCKQHKKDCRKLVGKLCTCKLSKQDKKIRKAEKKCRKMERNIEKKIIKKEMKCNPQMAACRNRSSQSIPQCPMPVTVPSCYGVCQDAGGKRTRGDYHFRPKNVFGKTNKSCQCCGTKTHCKVVECAPCSDHATSDYSFDDYRRRYGRSEPVAVNETCDVPMSCSTESSSSDCFQFSDGQKKPVYGVRGFFQNLRSLYPRCSYLKFYPPFKACSDKSTDEGQAYEIGIQENDHCYDTKSANRRVRYENATCLRKNCTTCPAQKPFVYVCRDCGHGTGDKGTCKCYKVYLSTQQNGPGPRKAFQETSTTETTEGPSSEAAQGKRCKNLRESPPENESNDFNEISRRIRPDSEFIFPYRNSEMYYVGHSSEKKRLKEKRKREKKIMKEERRCRKKLEKEMKKARKKCTCIICGKRHNRHKCKKKKKKKKCDECNKVECECKKPRVRVNIDPVNDSSETSFKPEPTPEEEEEEEEEEEDEEEKGHCNCSQRKKRKQRCHRPRQNTDHCKSGHHQGANSCKSGHHHGENSCKTDHHQGATCCRSEQRPNRCRSRHRSRSGQHGNRCKSAQNTDCCKPTQNMDHCKPAQNTDCCKSAQNTDYCKSAQNTNCCAPAQNTDYCKSGQNTNCPGKSGHNADCCKTIPSNPCCPSREPKPNCQKCCEAATQKPTILSFLRNIFAGKPKTNNQCCPSKTSVGTRNNTLLGGGYCNNRPKQCYATFVSPPPVEDHCQESAESCATCTYSSCPDSNNSEGENKCNCKPILEEIECRLEHLEKCEKSAPPRRNTSDKSLESESSMNPTCYGCRDKSAEKKIKRERKRFLKDCKYKCKEKPCKMDRKKCRAECEACAFDIGNRCATAAYHVNHIQVRNPMRTHQMLTTTTTTTAEETSTSNNNSNSNAMRENSSKTNKCVMERLSAIPNLICHLRKYSKENGGKTREKPKSARDFCRKERPLQDLYKIPTAPPRENVHVPAFPLFEELSPRQEMAKKSHRKRKK